MVSFKVKLNQAFRALRKRGFIARQNFMCCGGCAGNAIANEAEDLLDRGKVVAGGVFYHKQAGASLREGKSFFVNYGQIDTQKHGLLGILSDEEIGWVVVEEFEKAGLAVDWDGSANRAIEVLP